MGRPPRSRRAGILAAALGVPLLLFLGALAAPAPQTWGKPPEDTPRSVRVDLVAERSLLGAYSIGMSDVEAQPMTWLVWDAIRHNPATYKLCLFCTDERELTVTIANDRGQTARLHKELDGFSYLGDKQAATLVFLDVLPGSYSLSASIHSPDGEELATYETTFDIIAT